MAVVSVVVPVYCNAPSLPVLAKRLADVAGAHAHHQFEFVYVDDGSTDDSYAVLRRLARQDHRVRVLKLTRNVGANAALIAGITYATGDCVAFVAADLQDPPETLTEMLCHWEAGRKVVLAARTDRSGDPWSTRLLATIFNRLFRLVFRQYTPEGIGFFLIDRQVAEVIIRAEERNAHVIGLILWTGFAYATVRYTRVSRQHGSSGWTFSKKAKYAVDAFTAFSYLPLRIATVLGLTLAALGGLYACLVVAVRLSTQAPIPGFTALMVVLLVTSGVQLLMLGVIGEYLWRTLEAARRRPLFIVETEVDGRTLAEATPDRMPEIIGRME